MGSTPFDKRLWVASVLAALSVAMSDVIAQILPLNPSRYRIIPAPDFPTGRGGSARAFEWVDNDRLLFLVNDRQLSQIEQRDGRTVITKAVPTIHLWDFRAGTITRYRDEPFVDHLCASEGRVYYGLRRDGKKVTFEGTFGEEREREATPRRADKGGRPISPAFNRYSCKEYWHADVPRPNGGRALLLREEHGLYERASSNSKGEAEKGGWLPPYEWWNHVGGKSTRIPFPSENIREPLGYSDLADGYLFRPLGQQHEGMRNKFFLWRPRSNTVHKLEVLGSANWNALYGPVLTRAGLIAESSAPTKNRRARRDVGPAGLYLFSGPPIEEFIGTASREGAPRTDSRPFVVHQIVSGLIDERSQASPDGCRIVIVVDPWDGENRRFRLEAIDLCASAG
jgi:hypothetical protein